MRWTCTKVVRTWIQKQVIPSFVQRVSITIKNKNEKEITRLCTTQGAVSFLYLHLLFTVAQHASYCYSDKTDEPGAQHPAPNPVPLSWQGRVLFPSQFQSPFSAPSSCYKTELLMECERDELKEIPQASMFCSTCNLLFFSSVHLGKTALG